MSRVIGFCSANDGMRKLITSVTNIVSELAEEDTLYSCLHLAKAGYLRVTSGSNNAKLYVDNLNSVPLADCHCLKTIASFTPGEKVQEVIRYNLRKDFVTQCQGQIDDIGLNQMVGCSMYTSALILLLVKALVHPNSKFAFSHIEICQGGNNDSILIWDRYKYSCTPNYQLEITEKLNKVLEWHSNECAKCDKGQFQYGKDNLGNGFYKVLKNLYFGLSIVEGKAELGSEILANLQDVLTLSSDEFELRESRFDNKYRPSKEDVQNEDEALQCLQIMFDSSQQTPN